ncbi:helix-turn-helix domain-containing protein [Amycolatopsis tucumanensis]|uniref:XRE family transcriptional regulator n=1 Tax=Amycolatopsis tucumanensis TaxID=401106 RepID=A0ABP7JN44_9PSEU|nr:XRE family transcriptional regulator [Amycolatopsis tucumanensis]MCF6424506.1 XRE family transcriptional regulator [Amycolatopsis tucumanensis]
MEDRLAARLAELRAERGWSLDDLADRSGISRSTLSRVERGEISPTASLLGKLCTVYERPMSRLLTEVEAEGAQVVRASAQSVWTDEDSGFVRRSVSPPHPALRAEVVEGTLRPGADIRYDAPSVPGLEQHLWLLDGRLELTGDGETHVLEPGDCLRFRLWGPTRFVCSGPEPARYLLVLVMP